MESNNKGYVQGVVKAITPYKTLSGEAWNRLDIIVASVSEYEHPRTVSVHSTRRSKTRVSEIVSISYSASTYLARGKSPETKDTLFDQTRLIEIEE